MKTSRTIIFPIHRQTDETNRKENFVGGWKVVKQVVRAVTIISLPRRKPNTWAWASPRGVDRNRCSCLCRNISGRRVSLCTRGMWSTPDAKPCRIRLGSPSPPCLRAVGSLGTANEIDNDYLIYFVRKIYLYCYTTFIILYVIFFFIIRLIIILSLLNCIDYNI